MVQVRFGNQPDIAIAHFMCDYVGFTNQSGWIERTKTKLPSRRAGMRGFPYSQNQNETKHLDIPGDGATKAWQNTKLKHKPVQGTTTGNVRFPMSLLHSINQSEQRRKAPKEMSERGARIRFLMRALSVGARKRRIEIEQLANGPRMQRATVATLTQNSTITRLSIPAHTIIPWRHLIWVVWTKVL